MNSNSESYLRSRKPPLPSRPNKVKLTNEREPEKKKVDSVRIQLPKNNDQVRSQCLNKSTSSEYQLLKELNFSVLKLNYHRILLYSNLHRAKRN